MARDKELEKYKENSSKRIRWIVDNFCGGSQQKLADKASLNKGSVSQYVSGRNTPSNLTAKKIANVFDLNPAWIMGFEVPMHEESEEHASESTEAFQQRMFEEKHALFAAKVKKLNKENMDKAEGYIDALLSTQDDNN